MTKAEFLTLMHFPDEWQLWDMYPDELALEQISGYQLGHEASSEHDRNGAFHWWIRQNPTAQLINKLIPLAFLDPDPLMGADVLRHLRKCDHFSPAHIDFIAGKQG